MPDCGKRIVLCIGIYLLAKAGLNLIIGFSLPCVVDAVIAVTLAVFLFRGAKYANYLTIGVLLFIVVWHLKENLVNLPGTLIYLIEAVLDVAAAGIIGFHPDARAYFEKES